MFYCSDVFDMMFLPSVIITTIFSTIVVAEEIFGCE